MSISQKYIWSYDVKKKRTKLKTANIHIALNYNFLSCILQKEINFKTQKYKKIMHNMYILMYEQRDTFTIIFHHFWTFSVLMGLTIFAAPVILFVTGPCKNSKLKLNFSSLIYRAKLYVKRSKFYFTTIIGFIYADIFNAQVCCMLNNSYVHPAKKVFEHLR